MAVAIVFGGMNINLAADNAGVANGANQGFGWNSHLKQSQCLRMQGVLSPTPANFNFVVDNDVFDYNIIDNDFTAGGVGQTV